MTKKVAILVLLLLAGCGRPTCWDIDQAVVQVADCTNAHSNVMAAYPGRCRVELADGSRATMDRPVMVGDHYRDRRCKYE